MTLETMIKFAAAREKLRFNRRAAHEAHRQQEQFRMHETELLRWLAYDLGEDWCIAAHMIEKDERIYAEIRVNGIQVWLLHLTDNSEGDTRGWFIHTNEHPVADVVWMDDGPRDEAHDRLLVTIGRKIGLVSAALPA